MTPEEIKKILEKQLHLISEQSQRIYVTAEQLAELSKAMSEVTKAIVIISRQRVFLNIKDDRLNI